MFSIFTLPSVIIKMNWRIFKVNAMVTKHLTASILPNNRAILRRFCLKFKSSDFKGERQVPGRAL